MKKGQRFSFYGVALNSKGQIEQLIHTREKLEKASKPISQEWTGKIYKSMRDANSDMEHLNCGAL